MRKLFFLLVLVCLYSSCSKKDNDEVISISDDLPETIKNIDDDDNIEG